MVDQSLNDFLRKIVEAPAGDTERLTLADWLEENADNRNRFGNWAKFVRLQVYDAKREPCPSYPEISCGLSMSLAAMAEEADGKSRLWMDAMGIPRELQPLLRFKRGMPEVLERETPGHGEWPPQTPGLILSVNTDQTLTRLLGGDPENPPLWAGLIRRINLLNTETTGECLCAFPNLIDLEVGGSPVGDEGAAIIGNYNRSMVKLNLSHTPLTDDGIRELRVLKDLESLTLTGTGITDRSTRYIAQMTKMKSLHVASTGVTEQGVASLTGLKDLETLRANEDTTAPMINAIRLGNLPKLTKLTGFTRDEITAAQAEGAQARAARGGANNNAAGPPPAAQKYVMPSAEDSMDISRKPTWKQRRKKDEDLTPSGGGMAL